MIRIRQAEHHKVTVRKQTKTCGTGREASVPISGIPQRTQSEGLAGPDLLHVKDFYKINKYWRKDNIFNK